MAHTYGMDHFTFTPSALFLRAVDGADDATLEAMLAAEGYRFVEKQIIASTLDHRRGGCDPWCVHEGRRDAAVTPSVRTIN